MAYLVLFTTYLQDKSYQDPVRQALDKLKQTKSVYNCNNEAMEVSEYRVRETRKLGTERMHVARPRSNLQRECIKHIMHSATYASHITTRKCHVLNGTPGMSRW